MDFLKEVGTTEVARDSLKCYPSEGIIGPHISIFINVTWQQHLLILKDPISPIKCFKSYKRDICVAHLADSGTTDEGFSRIPFKAGIFRVIFVWLLSCSVMIERLRARGDVWGINTSSLISLLMLCLIWTAAFLIKQIIALFHPVKLNIKRKSLLQKLQIAVLSSFRSLSLFNRPHSDM